jgi:hypothetical protein
MPDIGRKNIIFYFLLIAVLMLWALLGSISFLVHASFAEAVSSPIETIEISTGAELFQIPENPTANFILTNDIDLEIDISWQAFVLDHQNGWRPIDASNNSGSFDGKGHKILNLYINRPNENQVAFIAESSMTIKNLEIQLKELGDDSAIIGGEVVGSIIAVANAPLINCLGKGILESQNIIGGLVGETTSEVNNSEFVGKVTGKIAGGLIGNAISANIFNSLADANVCGKFVGGLIGIADYANRASSIRDSLSYSILIDNVDIVSLTRIGGLIGVKDDGVTVQNCYTLDEYPAVAQGMEDGITWLNEFGFLVQENFQFNFESIWYFAEDSYYPEIRHIAVVLSTQNHPIFNSVFLYRSYFYIGEEVSLDFRLANVVVKDLIINGNNYFDKMTNAQHIFIAEKYTEVEIQIALLLPITVICGDGGGVGVNCELLASGEQAEIKISPNEQQKLKFLIVKFRGADLLLQKVDDNNYTLTVDAEILESDELLVYVSFEDIADVKDKPNDKPTMPWHIILPIGISIIVILIVVLLYIFLRHKKAATFN